MGDFLMVEKIRNYAILVILIVGLLTTRVNSQTGQTSDSWPPCPTKTIPVLPEQTVAFSADGGAECILLGESAPGSVLQITGCTTDDLFGNPSGQSLAGVCVANGTIMIELESVAIERYMYTCTDANQSQSDPLVHADIIFYDDNRQYADAYVSINGNTSRISRSSLASIGLYNFTVMVGDRVEIFAQGFGASEDDVSCSPTVRGVLDPPLVGGQTASECLNGRGTAQKIVIEQAELSHTGDYEIEFANCEMANVMPSVIVRLTVTEPPVQPTDPPITQPSGEPAESISDGAIVGIVVAVTAPVGLVLLLILIIYLFWWRRRSGKTNCSKEYADGGEAAETALVSDGNRSKTVLVYSPDGSSDVGSKICSKLAEGSVSVVTLKTEDDIDEMEDKLDQGVPLIAINLLGNNQPDTRLHKAIMAVLTLPNGDDNRQVCQVQIHPDSNEKEFNGIANILYYKSEDEEAMCQRVNEWLMEITPTRTSSITSQSCKTEDRMIKHLVNLEQKFGQVEQKVDEVKEHVIEVKVGQDVTHDKLDTHVLDTHRDEHSSQSSSE